MATCRWPIILAAAAAMSLLPVSSHAAEPRIDIEVCTDPDFPLTDAGKWNTLLGELGLSSVRIRGAQPGDAPSIKRSGKDESPTYRVVGMLTADGKLNLPNRGRFAIGDKARLAAWFDKLRADGIEAIATKPAAFGLLPSQLVEVHETLKTPVKFSTKGQAPRDVAKKIADTLPLKFITDAASQRTLGSPEPVADELQGLSAGTAIAAVLRPLGLVMVPEKSEGILRLRIADSRSVKEHWPIGWPPKAAAGETVPELFKFLNVEITDFSLGETLQAIGGRVKVPMVIDYNALARLDVDLAKTKVELPKANTFYGKALDRILFQANLKYEVRTDEADKPFLWISGIK
jgi:hypothetical protein